MESEEAEFARQMQIKQFDRQQKKEDREFWATICLAISAVLIVSTIAFSGYFESKGASEARTLLVPILLNFVGIALGRMSKSGINQDSKLGP